MTRAQKVNRFRAAVAPDPAHCAGLVAWELKGMPSARVREVLTKRQLLVGGTESYGGFFGIPEDRPGASSSRMPVCSHRLTMWIAWLMRSKRRHAHDASPPSQLIRPVMRRWDPYALRA
jgi:hypothetical protein